MEVFNNTATCRSFIKELKDNKKSIGFVPTMGTLHEGHISLVERARKENDIVVVSIYVNPTQFNNTDDLQKYPRQLGTDLELLKKHDCDIVFTPSDEEMYPDGKETMSFDFEGLDTKMEGAFRPGHFDGVATVVKLLFDIAQPTRAYFGEKDFQQLAIIRKMGQILKLPIEIIGCPIFREVDGLAMSSRNLRLNEKQRAQSPVIYQALQQAQEEFAQKDIAQIAASVKQRINANSELELEYFEVADELTLEPTQDKESDKTYYGFIAVFAGEIRLIDNIRLN